VNVRVNVGNAQRDEGKTDEAILSYHRAEMLNPAYPDISLHRGQLHQETSQFAEAKADCVKLSEDKPDDAASYLRAASSATDAGQFREAIDYCMQAIEKLTAVPVQLETVLATTYERLGDLDEAIRWTEKVLAERQDNAGALRTWSKARRRKDKKNPRL